jgi:hypothetical protein
MLTELERAIKAVMIENRLFDEDTTEKLLDRGDKLFNTSAGTCSDAGSHVNDTLIKGQRQWPKVAEWLKGESHERPQMLPYRNSGGFTDPEMDDVLNHLFAVQLADWFDLIAGTSTGSLLAIYCRWHLGAARV